MENEESESKVYKLGFSGKGSEFFGIVIINWLLNIVTLHFYSAWANAKTLQYLYGSSTLNGDNFTFHGTGKEMFKGYLKLFLIFIVLFATCGSLFYFNEIAAGIAILYFSLIIVAPIIIHGKYRYQLSRSSWRGIRFGYHGNRKDMIANYFKWIFFTIISLGIYASWMVMNMTKYIVENIRLGDIEFRFSGKGKDYLLMALKGGVLSVITLGVYFIWYWKTLVEYFLKNISLYRNGKEIRLKSSFTIGQIFQLTIVNYFAIVLSLGIALPWVVTRSMKIITKNIVLEGDIDLDNIQQTEDDYTEEESNILDINFVM